MSDMHGEWWLGRHLLLDHEQSRAEHDVEVKTPRLSTFIRWVWIAFGLGFILLVVANCHG